MIAEQHSVTMSPRRFPRGLRLFECDACRYAFMAEVYPNDRPDFATRVPINNGDGRAAHSLFFAPEITLRFVVGANALHAPDGDPGCVDC